MRANDLSPQQWRVLRALVESQGLEISALAERCHLLMPSLSRIIQNLEGRNLVIRSTSSKDQRCSIISITQEGTLLVERMSPESEARYKHITEVFGFGKLELLYELLDELVEKLEASEDNPTTDSSTEVT